MNGFMSSIIYETDQSAMLVDLDGHMSSYRFGSEITPLGGSLPTSRL